MRALAALLLLAGALLATAPGAGAVTLRGTVSQVVDGDTIKVVSRGFETPVRLVGIDTPETRHPTTGVQCYGPEATARTRRLLPVGRRVRLQTDPTQAVRDRYGRLLAYVYVGKRTGATGSVNHALVAGGHARVYVYGGVRFRYAVPFFKAQNRARRAKRGLWGPPCNGSTTPRGGEDRTSPASRCDPNYAGACIPPAPPDLDCGDIPYRGFRSIGSDPHRFDGDGDGIACEPTRS